jgi:hypothetical protein
MGFLKSLINTAVDLSLVPLAVTQDVLTLGEHNATAERLASAAQNTSNAVNELI